MGFLTTIFSYVLELIYLKLDVSCIFNLKQCSLSNGIHYGVTAGLIF
jgi:hypothetical protein